MKWYKKIEEIIEGELSDYSYFAKYEIHHNQDYSNDPDEEYYDVDIWILGDEEKEYPTKTLNFRVTEDETEIELGEDSWQKFTDYDYRIKYFWMALLSWEI